MRGNSGILVNGDWDALLLVSGLRDESRRDSLGGSYMDPESDVAERTWRLGERVGLYGTNSLRLPDARTSESVSVRGKGIEADKTGLRRGLGLVEVGDDDVEVG